MDTQNYQAPGVAVQPQQGGNHVQILVLGIIGLALAGSGIPGLVLSIIALVKSNQYTAKYGTASTQAKIGRILAIVGLVLSIVCIVVAVIVSIALAVFFANHGAEIGQAIEEAIDNGSIQININ